LENNLHVSSSPHIRTETNTRDIMLDVIIALVPASVMGVYFFGYRALLVILVTVLAAVLAEYLAAIVLKRKQTIGDLSAVVTGLLLALNFPPSIPFWIAIVGAFIAIMLVKQLFGGIGQNFMNPALAARVILLISWPVQMTRWVWPDGVSSATPLVILKRGLMAQAPGYLDLFLGNVAGCIGETSAAALLIGGIYLVVKKVIGMETPLAFIGTVGLFTWIFAGGSLFTGDFLYHILAGGLILGAFFMATDYSTTPVTRRGKIIFGIGCGILASVIRLYTDYPEGVSFAIILMNVATQLIDRFTVPRSFGGEKNAA
jgi:electron transport complex protein RnfD